MADWKNLGAAISLSNLLLFGLWDEAHDYSFDYYRKLPGPWFLPTKILISLLLYTALTWGVWTIASRARNIFLRRTCVLLLTLQFWLGLDIVLSQLSRLKPSYAFVSAQIGLSWLAILIASASAILVILREEKVRSLLQPLLLIFLPALAILLFATVSPRLQTSYRTAFENRPLAPLAHQKPDLPRVVWIIFDELDQRWAFTTRPKDVKMPELDRFRRDAFYAEGAKSPEMETERSIPSLLTGRVVKKTERSPGDLMLTFEEQSTSSRWSEQPSVFSDAHELGVNTALAGFFHPYCRILSNLSDCSWFPASFLAGYGQEYLDSLTVPDKLLFYLKEPLLRSNVLEDIVRPSPSERRVKHLLTYRHISEHAMEVATNAKFGLVFLHFSVPHLPGIYDRVAGTVTVDPRHAYLDNLGLVDQTLGELRKRLETAHLWDKTIVVISADHPLREGTRTEAVREGDQLDAFPQGLARGVPFLIGLHGRVDPLTYSNEFNTVLTRRLVVALLKGEITNSAGIAAWLDRNRLQ